MTELRGDDRDDVLVSRWLVLPVLAGPGGNLGGPPCGAERERAMTAVNGHSAGQKAASARGTSDTTVSVGAIRRAGECTPPVRTGAMRRTTRGYASGREDYLIRLRKIEGQVRGLQRMIEADTWCPDVVTQVASATRALQEVAVGLLSDHLRHCVAAAVRDADPGSDEAFDEVAGSIRQVIRL